jgi:hypothetical protein
MESKVEKQIEGVPSTTKNTGKYCPKCNYTDTDAKFKFCPECGTELRKVETISDVLNQRVKLCRFIVQQPKKEHKYENTWKIMSHLFERREISGTVSSNYWAPTRSKDYPILLKFSNTKYRYGDYGSMDRKGSEYNKSANIETLFNICKIINSVVLENSNCSLADTEYSKFSE